VIRSAAAAALVLVFGAAGGQPASTTPETSNTLERAPASSSQDDLRSKFLDREDGQLDLGDFLAKPRRFLPVPIIVTEPAVGYGGGGVALFLRPREEAGKEGWSRPNMSVVGRLATRNGTWAAFAGDSSRWMEGRLRTLAGGGAGQVNLDFYGVTDERSSLDVKTRYSLRFTGALMQANWKIAADSAWSVGVRYVYASVDPRLRDDPMTLAVARPGRVEISAPTAVLEYDSRDNVFTPTRGYLCRDFPARIARGLRRQRRFHALRAARAGVASPSARRDARRARQLRGVVVRHAILPPSLHRSARRSGHALSGRSGRRRRARRPVAVSWPLERSRLRGHRPGEDAARCLLCDTDRR